MQMVARPDSKRFFANAGRIDKFIYFSTLNSTTGIVKFNEVYLGEAGVEGSDLQDGARSPHSGTGVGGGPLTLEQYISNAREALGVDSHYSRCVLTANLFSDTLI